jgi:hypothetical protein
LDKTLFSVYGYKFTDAYKHPELDMIQTQEGVFWRDSLATDIFLRVKQLAEKTRVHFYESTVWFATHRPHIKQFVAWCDQNTGGDYYLTENTLYNYLEYAINSRKAVVITDDNAAADLPEVNVHNYTRLVVATLERLALWQGVTKYTKNLTTQDPFKTLYNDVINAANTARATKPLDYGAIDRSVSKRIQVSSCDTLTFHTWWSCTTYSYTQVDERESLNEALFTSSKGFSNDNGWMRTVLEDKLGDACGRRGEDLREVRQRYFTPVA